MATATGKRTRLPVNFSLDAIFDGVIQTSVRSSLVVEYIKYIMYQRQQIPLPFDQIKEEAQQEKNTDETVAQQTPNSKRKRGICKLESRRRQMAVESLEKVFSTLEDVFTIGGPIKQIIIIIGATVVSPKEVYILNFPTSFFDSHILSFKNCMSVLFRNLVVRDWFGDVKPLKSCSKLHVLLQAPRDCNFSSQQLLPKFNFKIPQRGKHFVLNFVCRAHIMNAELSQLGDTDFNISGVEPLNHSVSDIDMGPPMKSSSRHGSFSESGFGTCSAHQLLFSKLGVSNCSKSRQNSMGESGMDIDSLHLNESRAASEHSILDASTDHIKDVDEGVEYIWYAVPVTVKGYKDKSSRKIHTTDDWLL